METVVPDLVGLLVADARQAGHHAGVVVVSQHLDGPPLGALTWPGTWLVDGQVPAAGTAAARWDVVRITWRQAGGDDAGVREPRLPGPDPGHLEAARERD